MDQVKQILAVVKKQHFWILSGVLLIVGLGAWHLAVGKLADQYQQRETKLNGDRKSVQEINRQEAPPNQLVVEAINGSHKLLKDEVYRAWIALYQIQKENNPWPQVLKTEFIEAAEALKPGEDYLKPGEEFKDPMHLDTYRYFINEYLPKLGLIIDVREPKSAREERLVNKAKTERRTVSRKKIEKKKPAEDAGEKKKAAQDESAEDEIVGKVIWDPGNEQMIRQQFEWEARPTTLEILIAQENLWIYEALLRIVRDTNEGANSYYKAPVKQIFSLEIGREAATALSAGGAGGGTMSGMPGMGSGMPGMGSGMPGMSAGAMSGGASAQGGGADASAAPSSPQEMAARALLDGRYVDQKRQPLAFGSEVPFRQFKMMPVRMVLMVDQRRIPRLLAQCANSSMPVEVTRVILRPDQVQALSLGGATGGSSGAGGMPGMAGGMPGMSGMSGMSGGSRPSMGMSSPMGSGASGGMPGSMPGMKSGGMSPGKSGMGSSRSPGGMAGAGAAADEESPWDMKVEIQGIIYIFNPPDRSKFETGEGEAAAAAGAAAQPGVAPAEKAGGTSPAPAAGAPAGRAPGEDGKAAPPTANPAAPAAIDAPAAGPEDQGNEAAAAKGAAAAPAKTAPAEPAAPKATGAAAAPGAKTAPAKDE